MKDRYTVKELSDLSGISKRTLRYYDEIDLLKPDRLTSSGYRIYTQKEVNKLQQILFYRALKVNLKNIQEIINSPDFDELKALRKHFKKMLKQKEQLDLLLQNIKKTIVSIERGITMSNQEKFEGFKKKLIEENEAKYGEEICNLYGKETVRKSNEKVKNMTKSEHESMMETEKKLLDTLKEAMSTNDPAGPLAQKAADLHRQWLSFYWPNYNKEAHEGLVIMYVSDKRFTEYYEKIQSGATEFLKNAVLIYTQSLK
ncbi:MAG: MerR family transcriptional regulator [Atribacterota bacterium]|nr:MerR family transcriptional regulator [Atribacterota bacterium]